MKICTSVLTRAVVAAGALLQVGTATPVRAAEPTENLAAGASLLQPMTPVSHETAEPAAEALNSPPLCPAGNVSALRYNNPGLTVDLGVGLWGIPIPYDYDGDGVKDLLVSCPDRPYKGLYYFKNIGTAKKPLFAAALRISEKGLNNIRLSEVDGTPYVLSKETEHLGFFEAPYAEKRQIEYEGEVLGATYKKSRSNMWNYVDWDNDGDKDIVVGIDTWDDYGWDNAYDAEGRWTRGPLHGYVYLLENVGGNYVNRGKIEAGGMPIDVYGAPNPCIADFDGDGDLDLICGEFVDGLTWFENTGTRSEPRLAAGRQLANKKGEIRFHIEMIVPVVSDFDGDGRPDLVVGDEDGRVAWVRNTGKVRKGMPQFGQPLYFRQEADLVKFGALSTPCAFDWDGDGKQDIIAGNSAGEIALIRNLSGGENPVWDAPRLFCIDGEPLRIQAGENGSIQGPAERKWGYTVLSVADWDGDGLPDIIVNSIWGKIEWFRNLGAKDGLALAPAQPVRVAWEGEAPKPAWNWWNPEPGTLTTQWRTTPVAMDWNGDGLTDLVVMDHEGYLAYFERFRTPEGELLLKPGRRIFHATNCALYSAKKGVLDTSEGLLRLNDGIGGQSGRRKICFADWDGDGRMDLIVDSQNAAWFRNVREENGEVWYEYMGNLSDRVLAGHTTCPTPVDWDGDGRPDLLLGAEDGHFHLLKNNGCPE
ncbi:VCBS repeat-containing protein [uncultured Alistipes sp.]|uniref:FG-GAP repeat domain-containing protein n=1 Tax=uncultured Alistipes sp. TaxID=538949 RepID=UPI002599B20F|nr:VCBS repeat-containing protein [uncultured Alistipes sp.]